MRRLAALLLLIGVGAAALLPAAALELDRRRMLNAQEHVPWRGVGRVNIATATALSMCTGTLIAADLVLTAAHCVMSPLTGAPYRPADVHFVAGWRLGQMVASSVAKKIAVHPGYRLTVTPKAADIAADLALIRLADPIPYDKARPFEIAPAPGKGTPLTLISYRQDRPHALTRQKGCEILDTDGAVMALGCDVTFGASGSPLFIGDGAEAQVVAVVSARGEDGRQAIALAVLVDAALPKVLSALR